MVYLADSLALATLETLVHLEAVAMEQPYVALEFVLPGEPAALPATLPSGWQQDLAVTRELGSRWLREGAALALLVPSALVPAGSNILVNPAHPAADDIARLRGISFQWDARLL